MYGRYGLKGRHEYCACFRYSSPSARLGTSDPATRYGIRMVPIRAPLRKLPFLFLLLLLLLLLLPARLRMRCRNAFGSEDRMLTSRCSLGLLHVWSTVRSDVAHDEKVKEEGACGKMRVRKGDESVEEVENWEDRED
jgi:hypothetical protein